MKLARRNLGSIAVLLRVLLAFDVVTKTTFQIGVDETSSSSPHPRNPRWRLNGALLQVSSAIAVVLPDLDLV